jgi:diketogulonate reductase-like aldo/keto reductase
LPRREGFLAPIALAWLLYKPAVTAPIVGAIKPHHLEEVVAALDVKLSKAEIEELEAPYVPLALPDSNNQDFERMLTWRQRVTFKSIN